jgi:hypothetical protein
MSASSTFFARFSSISVNFSMINPLKANGIRSTPLCRTLALSRRGGFEEWRFCNDKAKHELLKQDIDNVGIIGWDCPFPPLFSPYHAAGYFAIFQ